MPEDTDSRPLVHLRFPSPPLYSNGLVPHPDDGRLGKFTQRIRIILRIRAPQ